jgi:hypothetical protein
MPGRADTGPPNPPNDSTSGSGPTRHPETSSPPDSPLALPSTQEKEGHTVSAKSEEGPFRQNSVRRRGSTADRRTKSHLGGARRIATDRGRQTERGRGQASYPVRPDVFSTDPRQAHGACNESTRPSDYLGRNKTKLLSITPRE